MEASDILSSRKDFNNKKQNFNNQEILIRLIDQKKIRLRESKGRN